MDALLGLTYSNTCMKTFLLTGNSHNTDLADLSLSLFLYFPTSLLAVVFLSPSSSRACFSCYPSLLFLLYFLLLFFYCPQFFNSFVSLGSYYSVAGSFFSQLFSSLLTTENKFGCKIGNKESWWFSNFEPDNELILNVKLCWMNLFKTECIPVHSQNTVYHAGMIPVLNF